MTRPVELEIEVAGRRHDVEVAPDGSHVTIDGRSFPVRCRRDGTQAIVSVGDMVHIVDFSGPRTAVVDGRPVPFSIHHLRGVAGAEQQGAGSHGPVRPPMSGRIERLLVEEGQEVGRGDVLFVLEAMKMRNEVKAAAAGRVAAIHAAAGDTVDTGSHVLDLLPLD